jgi:pimeloyl-ACP methyl ester carboxylesterase
MQLHYQIYGSGHPLIILHGLFGSLGNWHTLSKNWGNYFQVCALDQRNHGNSPHSDEFNYNLMAEDVKEFMLQQRLGSAYLLGHSMGGKTAMQFALNYPASVDKLIVVDIAPKAYPPNHEKIFAALNALDLASLASRTEADARLAQDIPDLSMRQFLLKNLARGAAGDFHWKMNLAAIYQNYQQINQAIDAAGAFDKPTLFVKGGKSHYIQAEDGALIKKLFPQAKIVELPQAGHWAHADAPKEFLQLIIDFLLTTEAQ